MIPAQHHEAWLAAELDWKSVAGYQVLKGYISGETVRDIVDGVDFVEPREFLEINWAGDEIQLRSFQGQAGFTESMVGFAAAWAAAARFGGEGELIGVGVVATRFGYRVHVNAGEASVVRIADEELDAFEAVPLAQAVRERMTAIGGAMSDKLRAGEGPRPFARPSTVASAPAPAKKKSAGTKKPAAKKSKK
ncbi:hypothetical protein [Enhygromyxa salina]|uniref:hypothetical protein n=1 Tax=Enhygromyxa salina TaxID=215803 RepID=UPI0004E692D7|nr:hypothetical protein [Enhygromyxa salina]